MIIDPAKKYVNGKGQEVQNIQIVPRNSAGDLVTFPVKGSVVIRKKPLKLEYSIWTMEGISDPVWHHNSWEDLVEVTE